eukprot:1158908-Pelagomonas_calceolata.AAC.2
MINFFKICIQVGACSHRGDATAGAQLEGQHTYECGRAQGVGAAGCVLMRNGEIQLLIKGGANWSRAGTVLICALWAGRGCLKDCVVTTEQECFLEICFVMCCEASVLHGNAKDLQAEVLSNSTATCQAATALIWARSEFSLKLNKRHLQKAN